MNFIQLDSEPRDGISDEDGYCIGIKVFDENEGRNDLYKFRGCNIHTQNEGAGWYVGDANKTSFKLHIKF